MSGTGVMVVAVIVVVVLIAWFMMTRGGRGSGRDMREGSGAAINSTGIYGAGAYMIAADHDARDGRDAGSGDPTPDAGSGAGDSGSGSSGGFFGGGDAGGGVGGDGGGSAS